MKKLISIAVSLLVLIVLSGCMERTYSPREVYNDVDKNDFQAGASVKFQLIQFKQVIDEQTLKEMNLDGGFFLFMGSVSATSKETTEIQNTYHAYLKNKNGGIYYAAIPANKVRIYEDAIDTPVIVAYKIDEYMQDVIIDVNSENKWNDYSIFNLHVPKGTVIPKIKDMNIGLDGIKK